MGLDRAKHASHPLGAIISYVSGLAAELFFRVFVVLAPICSRTRPGTACAPSVVLQNRPTIFAIVKSAEPKQSISDLSGLAV